MQSESFVFLLLFTLILIVPVCCLSTCMADCTSELTQRPPSLYEQYCCNDNNTGKTFKIRQNNVLKIIFCSDNSPISCEMYRTFLNCTDIFKHNRSALSGYYTMRAPNGSIISVYCDDNAFDNCFQVFKENSSALSGYYTMRAPNGSLISVYCDDNAFDNCSQVFKENSSALSGYYTMRAPNGSLISVYCDISFFNCSHILNEYSFAPSGYYTIQAPNGSLISVYCDMEGNNCDDKGGWMRVGYINMSESGATCPPGLTQQQYNNIDHDVCGLPNSGKFSHTFFSTQGIGYSKVCGQLRGYQYRSPDAFHGNNIESCYVDGISITHGSMPRKHIWTYAGGLTSDNVGGCCPCNSNNCGYKPNFIGDDYYCESGIINNWQHVLYVNDPLWDGQLCDGNEGPCCTNPKMPWFIKTLSEITTEDIELRVCADQVYPDEDTPLDIIELYIR